MRIEEFSRQTGEYPAGYNPLMGDDGQLISAFGENVEQAAPPFQLRVLDKIFGDQQIPGEQIGFGPVEPNIQAVEAELAVVEKLGRTTVYSKDANVADYSAKLSKALGSSEGEVEESGISTRDETIDDTDSQEVVSIDAEIFATVINEINLGKERSWFYIKAGHIARVIGNGTRLPRAEFQQVLDSLRVLTAEGYLKEDESSSTYLFKSRERIPSLEDFNQPPNLNVRRRPLRREREKRLNQLLDETYHGMRPPSKIPRKPKQRGRHMPPKK